MHTDHAAAPTDQRLRRQRTRGDVIAACARQSRVRRVFKTSLTAAGTLGGACCPEGGRAGAERQANAPRSAVSSIAAQNGDSSSSPSDPSSLSREEGSDMRTSIVELAAGYGAIGEAGSFVLRAYYYKNNPRTTKKY